MALNRGSFAYIKKAFFLFILLHVVILISSLSSAEILFSIPQSSYSIGDTVLTDITLRPSTNTNSFLDVELKCGNVSRNVYRSPYSLESGEEKLVYVDLYLSRNLLGNLSGNCYFDANYGSESARSSSFRVSSDVLLEASANSDFFKPGERIVVSGFASLEDGDAFEGIIEVQLDTEEIVSDFVSNGEFSAEIIVPEHMNPGRKQINVRAYQEDNTGEVTNEGFKSIPITVEEVMSEIEIEIPSQSVIPGSQTLKYKIKAYDQAGNEISREATLEVLSADGKSYSKSVVKSLEEKEISFESNSTPGYWEVVASSEDMEVSKKFYVEERELVEFRIENDTLVIINSGNVRYQKPIEISIGNETIVKDIDLKVGESKVFRLKAPDNSYEVSVRGSDVEFSASNVPLTGRAIDIGEIGAIGKLQLSLIGLMILILVIVLVIVLFFKRRGRFFGGKHKGDPGRKDDKMISTEGTKKAFVGGKKEDASVIALRLSNIGKDESSVIDESLVFAKEKGAKVYISGEFRLMIFSQTLTKNEDNLTLAVKTANEIGKRINDYNKRSKNRISFGLGINSGQVIIEKHDKTIQLTSLGNLVSAAKRISLESKGEILLSESSHGRVSGEVKLDRVKEINAWKVRSIVDRESVGGFVERFKK